MPEIGRMTVTNIQEKGDDVLYTFDLDELTSKTVAEEGIKLLLYCGVCGVDLDDVYDWILQQKENDK